MRVSIEGFDLPGRSCAPADAGQQYENIHVGVQRKADVVDLVPGDSALAAWSFDVTTKAANGGGFDFGGPFVHGRSGDRFLYLSWGVVDASGHFAMFRRAKLHLADIAPSVLAAAIDGTNATLVGRLGLTDGRGNPRCARVRPPEIAWSVRG